MVTVCAAVVANPELDRPNPIGSSWDRDYKASGYIDEMRSHLPAKLQQALGLSPFVYTYPSCPGGLCWVGPITSPGWDHEHYLRSVGRDVHGLCYDEYKRFTTRLGWIEGNGYWMEFMRMCKLWPSYKTSWHLEWHLPRALTKDCAQAIAAGWTVGDNGRFYHPDRPGQFLDGDQRHPSSFVKECLPYPPDYESFGYIGSVPREREVGVYLGYLKRTWLEYQ